MSTYPEDERMIELLALLRRLEPVTLHVHRERRRPWRPMLVAAIVVGALVGVGAAIADGFGAFDEISAAQHPQTGADAIDPATMAALRSAECDLPQCAATGRDLEFASARLVRTLPDGVHLYVITNKEGDLCVLVGAPRVGAPRGMLACGASLSPSNPTTLGSVNPTGHDPTTFGVAIDEVTAISFQAAGKEVTVPVKDNVWAYEGNVTLEPVTAHFADGRTQLVSP